MRHQRLNTVIVEGFTGRCGSSAFLLATQSVTLMNQFELGDLIVVERRDGASVFERPDPDRLSEWLAEYSLGELREKNLLGGRPVSAL